MLRTSDLDTLAAGVLRGDREAFRGIVRATAVLLRAYVSFYLRDPDAVDDIVQDVFIQAYRDLDQYEPGTDFVAWIKTKAKFAALAERRRRERKLSARKRYVHRVQAVVTAAVEPDLEKEQLSEQMVFLRQCMKKLTGRARELVDLKYFRDLSLEEMGRRVGLQPAAVGTALYRARAALADCVDKGGHAE